jgi:hypothetical protein
MQMAFELKLRITLFTYLSALHLQTDARKLICKSPWIPCDGPPDGGLPIPG